MGRLKTSEKIRSFSKNFTLRRLAAKKTFITPHTIPEQFYFVENGYVRSFMASHDGDELTISIFGEETLLPLNPFYEALQPCLYFFETLTECSLRIIPNEEMHEFLNVNHEAKDNAVSYYLQSVNRVLVKANQFIFQDCSHRVVCSLVNLAESLGEVQGNTVTFKLSISHELLASLAGTTRETVTRKLGELKAKGVIQGGYGKLRILQMEELMRMIA